MCFIFIRFWNYVFIYKLSGSIESKMSSFISIIPAFSSFVQFTIPTELVKGTTYSVGSLLSLAAYPSSVNVPDSSLRVKPSLYVIRVWISVCCFVDWNILFMRWWVDSDIIEIEICMRIMKKKVTSQNFKMLFTAVHIAIFH